MILTGFLRDLFARREAAVAAVAPQAPRVLNVGGGSKEIPIPDHYAEWHHHLLDIDPSGAPDVVCDARAMTTLAPAQYDAIYCSHNLEHYYAHDVPRVLQGFLHVLKPDGFAEIRVPDVLAVMRRVVASGLEPSDDLYGRITVHDVLYGWGAQIERSGVEFYAHKCGFSAKSLRAALDRAGFAKVLLAEFEEIFELHAFAFKSPPTDAQRALLNI